MKATKKIVGAACALVAAVALSAGSTFAWFSSNDTVHVDGMKVQAKVPENLYICEGVADSVAAINLTKLTYSGDKAKTKELSPARLKYTEAADPNPAKLEVQYVPVDGFTTDPTGTSGGVVDETKVMTAGTIDLSNDAPQQNADNTEVQVGNYVALYTMSVNRVKEPQEECALDATVTLSFDASVTDLSKDNSWKFITVGFYTAEGFVSIENKNTALGTGNTLTFEFTRDNSKAVMTKMKSNAVNVIQFVVWYDGDNEQCYVNNALQTHAMNVTIDYSIPATPVTPGP